MLELRPYQKTAVDSVLRDLMDKSIRKNALVLPTGCHQKGQKILMYDGTLRAVENISVGEYVMGPDSKPRKVLQLCRGKGQMYKIIPTKGKPFVVNDEHILTLIRTNERKNPQFPCERRGGETIDVSVAEYLNWSENKRHLHKLFRVGVEFEHTPTKIDPYILGVWLGDGSSKSPSITTADKEIINSLYQEAENRGLKVRIGELANNKADTFFFTTGTRYGLKGRNNFVNDLRALNLWDNKHIPIEYKTNSTWTRLQLLAGILDSDGHQHHNGYDFVNKNRTLAEDTVYLARSLGLAAYIRPCRKRCVNTNVSGNYWRVYISGETHIIPCRLARKRTLPRKQIKDALRTGFRIEKLDTENFYGFTLNEDGRYLLDDFTVTHNSGKTLTVGRIVKKVLDGFKSVRGATVVFIAHRDELIEQTMDEFRESGIPCSRWTAEKKDLSGQVIVAMVQSSRGLPNALEENNRTVVWEVVDEGHHHAADSYQQLSYNLKSPKTTLVTATPIRSDGMDLGIEKISYQISFLELVRQGYLSKPDYHLIRIRGGGKLRSGGDDYKREDLEKLDNKDRNVIIAQDFQKNREAYGKTLCFCVNVSHAFNMRSTYQELMPDLRTAVVTGDMPKAERKAIVSLFNNGEIDVLFNVNVFTEGTNVPSINTIQIARPTKSSTLWCLDEKTEVLSASGWRNVDDIKDSDTIATWDKNQIKWSPILAKTDHITGLNEHFYSIESNRMSIRVTNKHRMLVRPRHKNAYEVMPACEVPKDSFYIPVSGMECVPNNKLSKAQLEFLGWFLSDGCFDKSNQTIRITQAAHQLWLEEFETTLTNTGMHWKKYEFKHPVNGKKHYRYQISKCVGTTKGWSQLEEFIDKDLGSAYESLSREQLGYLLHTLHLGDGAKQLGQDWTRRSYHISTGNRIFADRLQSLCVRRGYACNIATHTYNQNPLYILHIKDQQERLVGGQTVKDRPAFKQEELPVYTHLKRGVRERVWCVETNEGTIITRRNGKVAVLGNCQMVGRGSRVIEGIKDRFLIADYADTENNYAWLADGFAQELLGVPPDEELEVIRAEQDFVAGANEWLKEEGSSKKLKTQTEVIDLAGILMLRNRQGKEKRLIVRKQHKPRLDAFWNYFLENPPIVGTSMQGYVDNYMNRINKSLLQWPGKYIMYSLGWCLYGFYIARKGEGKPWALFKPVPDFNAINNE